MAFLVVGVVVVVVVAVVVVKITGGSTSTNGNTGGGPGISPATPAVLSAITGVTPAIQDAVGVPSSIQPYAPTVEKGQAALTINGGTPGSLFIGAEFCPLCGAERWAVIMAFSRFGTFSNLKFTFSSPFDSDPLTPTFTFRDVTYTSSYIHAKFIEAETNDTTGLGIGRKPLEPVSAEEQQLWVRYEPSGQTGFPFLDIDNKLVVDQPDYDPHILSGLDQAQVAAQLTNPNSTITQSIVGSANYLTAGICAATGQQPASVCSVGGVMKASQALGLS